MLQFLIEHVITPSNSNLELLAGCILCPACPVHEQCSKVRIQLTKHDFFKAAWSNYIIAVRNCFHWGCTKQMDSVDSFTWTELLCQLQAHLLFQPPSTQARPVPLEREKYKQCFSCIFTFIFRKNNFYEKLFNSLPTQSSTCCTKYCSVH